MPLIKDGAFIEDKWVKSADNSADAPQASAETGSQAGEHIIVSLETLQEDTARLDGFNGQIGVELANDADPDILTPWLDRLSLIALNFPKFADGRAYSQAKILRERHGFKGEIRATGDVLVDQAAYMKRCGFDAFEVKDSIDLAHWNEAMNMITATYQRDYRGQNLDKRDLG